jgi:hypothetical protein
LLIGDWLFGLGIGYWIAGLIIDWGLVIGLRIDY